jgi:hypothetical protein
VAGECRLNAPVAAAERWAMFDLSGSGATGAGHFMTRREHVCGDFKDDFDWSLLPVAYLLRIGVPVDSR